MSRGPTNGNTQLIRKNDFFFDINHTAWKVSKYGPEITPYLDTFHAVLIGILFNKENTKIEQSGSEREITLQR